MKVKITTLFERLLQDNEQRVESNSITDQKNIWKITLG